MLSKTQTNIVSPQTLTKLQIGSLGLTDEVELIHQIVAIVSAELLLNIDWM
jgi:hypothetical protein